MSDDKKRLIIFCAVAGIFLFLWQILYTIPQAEKRQAWEAQQQEKAEKEGRLTLSDIVNNKGGAEAKDDVDVSKPLAPAKKIKIQSDKLVGSFSLRGARFDDLLMEEFKHTMTEDSMDEILLSPIGEKGSYFIELGWLANNISVPDKNTLWQSDKDILTTGSPVTLFWDNGKGLVFKRVIELDENYLFTVTDKVENSTDNNFNLTPYGGISRSSERNLERYGEDTAVQAKQVALIAHEGPLTVIDEVLEEISLGDLEEQGKYELEKGKGWIAYGDKYWLTAIIPSPEDKIKVRADSYLSNGVYRYNIRYDNEMIELPAKGKISVKRHIFAGAKKVRLLNKYSEELQIPLLDRAIDYGWLYFLTKPIFALLLFFYDLIGNFGLAILSLTVVVKLLLFPLASKSYRSFARMKIVMPEMTIIKERYKDDRVKLQQETMALYKKHKVNPAAGCLPLLLQLPVFFALYKVLYISIEMRHAPFYGWIKDLSAPDPTTIFNIFGLLPFEATWLPMIGVLPVLYMVSMYIQQSLNPPPADPTQAMVMKALPLVFMFIFAGFPAGLVLYWVWNNILSIIQQYIITKKIATVKAPGLNHG